MLRVTQLSGFGIGSGAVTIGRVLANSGSYALVGNTAGVIKTSPANKILTAAAGSYGLTGTTAGLTKSTSLWTPAQLTTVKLWLKADTVSGSTGDPISTWTDASGIGNNATQSGSNRPTLQTAHQNGLNVVKFLASNAQYFDLPNAFTALTEGAIAFVAKINNDPPSSAQVNDGAIVKMGSTTAANNTNVYPYASNSLIYDDFGSTVRHDAIPHPATTLAAYHVGGFRSKASDWRFFNNGTEVYQTTTNTVNWTTTPAVGRSYNGGAWLGYIDGFIGEIVVLGEFASTSDWQKLEGYLAWKWGTVSTLDAGHPYKSAAP